MRAAGPPREKERKLPETAIPPSIVRRDYRFGGIASGALKISAPFT
ncbi:MAG: hypothetical protein BWX98_01746 [Candidatus Aminicenantes bacterium ADurb.Bin147]|nr:MAG: hypothetical protein BWX98_01746 [Candidatus Aminicenantes bacterium ADurb.Bin147]